MGNLNRHAPPFAASVVVRRAGRREGSLPATGFARTAIVLSM
jgi:hypothetical protein